MDLLDKALKDPRLNRTDIAIYRIILGFAKTETKCIANNKYFQKQTGKSQRTISATLTKLTAKGYIENLSMPWQRRRLNVVERNDKGRWDNRVIPPKTSTLSKNRRGRRKLLPYLLVSNSLVEVTDNCDSLSENQITSYATAERLPGCEKDSLRESRGNDGEDTLPSRNEDSRPAAECKSPALRKVIREKPRGKVNRYAHLTESFCRNDYSVTAEAFLLFEHWNTMAGVRSVKKTGWSKKSTYTAFTELEKYLKRYEPEVIKESMSVYKLLLTEPYTIFTVPTTRALFNGQLRVGLDEFFGFSTHSRNRLLALINNPVAEKLSTMPSYFEICKEGKKFGTEFFRSTPKIEKEELEGLPLLILETWEEHVEDVPPDKYGLIVKAAERFLEFQKQLENWQFIQDNSWLDEVEPEGIWGWMGDFIQELGPDNVKLHYLVSDKFNHSFLRYLRDVKGIITG